MIVSFILVPPVADGTEATGAEAAGAAGAGGAVATDAVGVAPVLGRNVPTSQVSLCGAKVTLSPLIPETRRPLTVVLPAPRRELSGCTARVKGPAEFWTWTSSALDVFSTV